ncbi:MAG: hypothetical protein EXR71_15400 [Myxococcales bacterium]|nr:hypothetical protein [Myxococcales bacterium]
MSDHAATPTATLFKQWRSQGDAVAGQAMAQRFSDWYYAITTCRLGDAHGRGPLQRACVRFQQGILTVTTPAELTEWSHGLLMEEVRMAGGRIAGGDFPNQLTGGRSPTELLRSVAGQLRPEDVELLALAYDSATAMETVTARAEPMGGYPVAVLKARLALKRALRDGAGIGLSEVPDSPNLDLAPMPLYEAGRMSREADEAGFEKWLLTDMRLCKDIAEFGVFAQAIRAGALRGAGVTPPKSRPSAKPVAHGAATGAVWDDEETSVVGKAAIALAIFIGLSAVGLTLLGAFTAWVLFF